MKNLIVTTATLILLTISNVMQSLLIGTIPSELNLLFNRTMFEHYHLVMDEAGLSTVWSVMNVTTGLGIIICIVFVLPLLDSKGRTFVNVHVRCLAAVGIGLLQCGSAYFSSAEAFLASQLLSGISLPLTHMTTVIFITECTPDKYRGMFSGASMLGNAFGAVVTFSLSRPGFFGNEHWPFISMASILLALLCYGLLLRVPDSPKWLLGKGRTDEARQAVIFYQGTFADKDQEIQKIQRELDITCKDKMSWKECWTDETVKSSLLIILSVSTMIEFSALNFEIIFSVAILGLLGVNTDEALTINSIGSILTIIIGFVGVYALDRLGRRPIVYIMFVSLYMKNVIMSYGLWTSFADQPTLLTEIIGLTNKFLSIFAGCGFVLPHLLIGELIPPAARVSVGQMALLLPVLISAPVNAIVPITLVVFPPAMYLLFCFTHPIFIQHIYRRLPETKNRAVCEIVDEVAEGVVSRRNTRASTVLSVKQSLLGRTRTSTYHSIN